MRHQQTDLYAREARNDMHVLPHNAAQLDVKPRSLTLSNIQGVYKRMVWFQKLTRNLFLTLHGQNVHRQQRQLSKNVFMH
jgi:hypothetical protein